MHFMQMHSWACVHVYEMIITPYPYYFIMYKYMLEYIACMYIDTR